MQSGAFLKLVSKVVRADWKDHGKLLHGLAGAMVLGIVLTMPLPPGGALGKGIVVGVGVVCPYAFAQICFFIQRRYGMLKALMTPPITPIQLVLAKYASVFTMALFIVNIPGVLLRDPAFLLYVNVGILFLTTVSMAVVVMWEKPWAGLIPLWVVLLPYLYARPLLEAGFRWVASHATVVSVIAVCLIPVIVYTSALKFEMDTRQS